MEILGIGVLIGCLRGGRIRNLAKIADLKGFPYFIVSLVLICLINLSINYELPAYMISGFYLCSFISLLLGLGSNIRISGMPFSFVGTLLNFLVLLSNGMKMPVSVKVLQWISLDSFQVSRQALTHSIIGPATNILFLADILIIPQGNPLSGAYSIGDIFLYFGVIITIQQIMVNTQKGDI